MMLYFDLDGPILDVSAKYWHVYCDVLAELGHSALPLDEYWSLKQKCTPNIDILTRTGSQTVLTEYTQMYLARIETQLYLAYDQVWPGVPQMLTALRREGHHLVLVTLRRSTEALHMELKTLCLHSLFERVLSSGEQRTPRWVIKADLIRADGFQPGQLAMIIGDTETDILAGKALGLQTVGVLGGIRGIEQLKGVEPDFLLESIIELGLVPGLFHPGSVTIESGDENRSFD